MQVISLSPFDLSVSGLLVIGVAILSIPMKLGLTRQMIVAALRTVVQLSLVGFVLKAIFENVHWTWMAGIATVMLLVAGREIMARQKRRFSGWWGFGVGTLSMFISSFSIMIFTLNVVINVHPWYAPQYAIPMLGMMLGNTMNGIAIGLDRLTQSAWLQRTAIEARLMLGHTCDQAIESIRRDSIRSALIPNINSMSIAGLVSLPGMMTGQILSGTPPMEAVKYQILIMFLITGGTGFGTTAALWLGARRLFDERQRLRLDRLEKVKN